MSTYNTLLSWAFSVWLVNSFVRKFKSRGTDGSVGIVTRVLYVRSRIRVPVVAKGPDRLFVPHSYSVGR
jgi:hypothetical protein